MKPSHLIFLLPLLTATPSLAGELGVTNSYGHSFQTGRGTSNVQWNTNSQLTEQSVFGAIKIEKSTFNQNNGWGNGDQDAPGNSGENNNAENGLGSNYTDRAFSVSFGFGTRNYTETSTARGNTRQEFSFGETNFTHSVGVFSR